MTFKSDLNRSCKRKMFREIEWLFSTNNGRKHLARITKYNRLAVIATHRGQEYGSLESVQDELHEAVCQVAPAGISGKVKLILVVLTIKLILGPILDIIFVDWFRCRQ